MKVENPFKLQNWKFKKFLIVILFFQLSLLGLFALNKLGMDTPIIRPLIGFIYLSFIPGYLLLRILRLHKLSSIESFLYALGLSLFMDMFVGFLINMFYPILGITNKPISEIPIVLTMAGTVFLLCVIAYFRDKDYYDNPDFIDLKDILNPQVLFLSLIPFMAIFGTYLVNYYHNNILLMIMIVVIALVALVIGFTSWIDKKYYPYAIWVIAIALVWHTTLITQYLIGYDVKAEYLVANDVIKNGIWLWNIKTINNYNSVLSCTILASVVYYLGNTSLINVFKIIYPLFLSFIPLGIYYIVQYIHKSKKISFLSVFLFISSVSYFNNTPFSTKQLIASIFLLLVLMITFSKNMNNINKVSLIILFCISLTWSHYGTSYLVIGMLMFTYIMLILLPYKKQENNFFSTKNILRILLIYGIFTLGWYMYVSNSSSFTTAIILGKRILESAISNFYNPDTARGAYLLKAKMSSINWILFKNIYKVVVFFIVVGYLKTLMYLKKSDLNEKIIYVAFAGYWINILVASVIIPYFSIMSPYRLFGLSLFTLAPFGIMGGVEIINLLNYILYCLKTKIIKKESSGIYGDHHKYNNALRIMYIFFIVYMLFNTQFIFEISKDPSSISASISQETIKKYGTAENLAYLYSKITIIYDVFSSEWLSTHKGNYNGKIHKMSYLNVVYRIGYKINSISLKRMASNISSQYRYLNMENNRVYDNGGSQIFLS